MNFPDILQSKILPFPQHVVALQMVAKTEHETPCTFAPCEITLKIQHTI